MGAIQYVVTNISLDRSTMSFRSLVPAGPADTNWTGAENRTGCHFFYEKLEMDWELGSKAAGSAMRAGLGTRRALRIWAPPRATAGTAPAAPAAPRTGGSTTPPATCANVTKGSKATLTSPTDAKVKLVYIFVIICRL
jgi:hypothetical protein